MVEDIEKLKNKRISEIATSNFFTFILPFCLVSFLCILSGFAITKNLLLGYVSTYQGQMATIFVVSATLILLSFLSIFALHRFYLNLLFEGLAPAFLEVKEVSDDLEQTLQSLAKQATNVTLFTDPLFLHAKYQLIAIEAALKEQLSDIVDLGQYHNFTTYREARRLLTGDLTIKDPINPNDLSKATYLDILDVCTKIELLKRELADRMAKLKP